MELTLTGASLSSNLANVPQGATQSSSHNSSVAQDATHDHAAGGECCEHKTCSGATNPSAVALNKNPEAFRRMLRESNVEARSVALTTAVKIGTYEAFKGLCNAVLQNEKELIEGNDTKFVASDCELLRYGQDGHTLAHWASKREDVRFLEYLSQLREGREFLNSPSKDDIQMRPLHWSASAGSIPNTAFLLQHIASGNNGQSVLTNSDVIDVTDSNGNTPLIVAAQHGHADLCAFLIKRGANPRALDSSKDTAMHWAAYKGVTPVFGLLCHIGWDANRNGNVIDYNDDDNWLPIDAKDAYGQTPLHLASLRGNAEVVQYLLEEVENRTAFSLSNRSDHRNSRHWREDNPVRHLLLHADVNGKTPLDLAVKKEKVACQFILREWEERYLHNNTTTYYSKIKRFTKSLFSRQNWRMWIGLGLGENDLMAQSNVRWPMALLVGSMIASTLLYPVKLTPITNIDSGLLWDHPWLHLLTVGCATIAYMLLFLTWKTNPGILGDDLSFDGNGYGLHSNVAKECKVVTTRLRSLYDDTIESYATSTGADKQSLPLCHSCHIAKPFRSKHCRVKRRCVLVFDHFCPFVGNAVGLYNYGYFYFFLVFFAITAVLFISTLVLYLHRKSDPFDWHVFLFSAYCGVMSIPAFVLLGYHTQLIRMELTTNEHQNYSRYDYLKGDRGEYHNPWKKNYFRNLIRRMFPNSSLYTIPSLTMSRSLLQVPSGSNLSDEQDTADTEKNVLLANQV